MLKSGKTGRGITKRAESKKPRQCQRLRATFVAKDKSYIRTCTGNWNLDWKWNTHIACDRLLKLRVKDVPHSYSIQPIVQSSRSAIRSMASLIG